MSDRSDTPDDFNETYRKLLGLDDSFSVKSHYPGFKAAARDLVESEARLRAMFEAIPFDLFLVGADGRYVLYNESFSQNVGAGRDSSVTGEEGGRELFQTGEGKDARWFLTIRSPVMVSGKRAGLVGVNIDVTDQKNAQEALRALNDNLERMVEERTEELRRANEELENKQISLERALTELHATQERLLESRYKASVGRMIASIAHELNSPLASTESAADHFASIHGDAIKAIATLRTLPEPLARLVERILSRQGDLPYCGHETRAALARRLATAGCTRPDDMADDLCDLGETEPAEDELSLMAGPDGEQAVNTAWVLGSMFASSALASKAARRSADVVRSLNAYLELTGEERLELAVFDLSEQLRHCVRREADAWVSIQLEVEEGLLVFGDIQRLELVWENLLENAVYAAGKAGRVSVSARSEGPSVLVSVEDNGAGIDPAIRDRLFEPLVSTKPMEEGKGLGLDMCRRIVDTHGGMIRFESSPGHTVFTVQLPRPQAGSPEQ